MMWPATGTAYQIRMQLATINALFTDIQTLLLFFGTSSTTIGGYFSAGGIKR